MTLYRQLLLYSFILLFFLFAGFWSIKLNSTKTFLSNQLESHAQDTATSLGLSLSTHAKKNDIAAMETMINAVFDRGYYRIIQLRNIKEEMLIDRTLEVTLDSVPAWFINIVPLATPSATALIMDNWNRAGFITVESHPGHAYETLWKTAVTTLIWFGIAAVIVAFLGGIGLQFLLRPLREVEQQALALCNKTYRIQDKIPRTRELQRVVTAMNLMTNKIREIFDDQAKTADLYRQRAYQDQLTCIGNRRYLEGQIKAKLTTGDDAVNGSFLLIQLNDLQALNLKHGYQAGDSLIKESAVIIKNACTAVANAAPCRLAGGDFALFLPSAGEDSATDIAASILSDLHRLKEKHLSSADHVAFIGGVTYQQGVSFNQLLAEADTALRSARHDGKRTPAIHPVSISDKSPLGTMQWTKTLQKALKERTVALFIQPTVNQHNRNEIIHMEILARITEGADTFLPARMFVPLAERLDLIQQLDRIIIEKALEANQQGILSGRIAVNLSPLSLKNQSFYSWLVQTLQGLPPGSLKFNFEFAELQAVQHIQLIKNFTNLIQKKGHYLGIDHFGQGLVHFGYLKSLSPNYVKIDKALTNELQDEESDSYFFINSLCNVAHSLDIRVMVEGVENEQQWQILQKVNLDAVQGYYIKKPELLDAH